MDSIVDRARYLEIDLIADAPRAETRAVQVLIGDEVLLYRGPGSLRELRAQLLRLITQHARALMAKRAVLVGEWDAPAAVAVGWLLKGRGVTDIFYQTKSTRVICVGYSKEVDNE